MHFMEECIAWDSHYFDKYDIFNDWTTKHKDFELNRKYSQQLPNKTIRRDP